MTNKQSEALRLADWLSEGGWPSYVPQEAAEELRRQHEKIKELEKENSYLNDACAELEARIVTTQQGMDASIIQALAAGISIQQWQSSVEILIGSSDLLVRAIASGKETRIELIRRAVSEALAALANQGEVNG